MEKESQSLYDYLLDSIWENPRTLKIKTSQSLYNLWLNGKKINDTFFNIPKNIDSSEIDLMKKDGLINCDDSKIVITEKGKETLKIMILGDSRSSFEDDGTIINYKEASNNVKPKSKPSLEQDRIESLYKGLFE